ncbi:hypothetical protein LMTR13_24315 [Bradyrhizobium icense]|uniref:Uncharacterized protein n=1 Tax=Bradyrhizobium icense TaxID=1274631 RepID=A0A1B1UJH6_9BRAD|nr:hypothetical protein LMTR13_24315 [Bradyrhizobium icense]
MSYLPHGSRSCRRGGADAIVIVNYLTALAAKLLGASINAALGLGDRVETRLIQASPGRRAISRVLDVAATLATKRLSLLSKLRK